MDEPSKKRSWKHWMLRAGAYFLLLAGVSTLSGSRVDRLAHSYQLRSRVEVVESDVTSFEMTPDCNVFYLYNPFAAPVLERVLKNIARSFETSPREIWLIYNTPIHGDLIHQSRLFREHASHLVGGVEFGVYRT